MFLVNSDDNYRYEKLKGCCKHDFTKIIRVNSSCGVLADSDPLADSGPFHYSRVLYHTILADGKSVRITHSRWGYTNCYALIFLFCVLDAIVIAS